MENRVNKKAKFASFQKGTKIEIALCNLTAAFQNQVLKSTWRTQFGHYHHSKNSKSTIFSGFKQQINLLEVLLSLANILCQKSEIISRLKFHFHNQTKWKMAWQKNGKQMTNT